MRINAWTSRRRLAARAGVLPWVWGHPANQQHRVAALLRAASFQVRGRVYKRPTVGTIGNKAKFMAEVGSSAASKAIYANPPDWPEMVVWQQRLRSGDLFVDVGANVGTYSLWAGDLGAEVIAVEPAPWAVARLRRNLALNKFSVTVVEAVATAHEGTERFDSSGDATAHIGAGIEVRATTLDAIVGDRQVAGVKIDVEGSERLVLQGAERALIEHRIGCLQLEWNDLSEVALQETRQPIVELLRAYRYSLYRPDTFGNLIAAPSPAFGPDVFALPDEAGGDNAQNA